MSRKRALLPRDRAIKVQVVKKLCECSSYGIKRYAYAEQLDAARVASIESYPPGSHNRRFLQTWGGHSMYEWDRAANEEHQK